MFSLTEILNAEVLNFATETFRLQIPIWPPKCGVLTAVGCCSSAQFSLRKAWTKETNDRSQLWITVLKFILGLNSAPWNVLENVPFSNIDKFDKFGGDTAVYLGFSELSTLLVRYWDIFSDEERILLILRQCFLWMFWMGMEKSNTTQSLLPINTLQVWATVLAYRNMAPFQNRCQRIGDRILRGTTEAGAAATTGLWWCRGRVNTVKAMLWILWRL